MKVVVEIGLCFFLEVFVLGSFIVFWWVYVSFCVCFSYLVLLFNIVINKLISVFSLFFCKRDLFGFMFCE